MRTYVCQLTRHNGKLIYFNCIQFTLPFYYAPSSPHALNFQHGTVNARKGLENGGKYFLCIWLSPLSSSFLCVKLSSLFARRKIDDSRQFNVISPAHGRLLSTYCDEMFTTGESLSWKNSFGLVSQ